MEKKYGFKEAENKVNLIWAKSNYFSPKIDPAKKPFSIFLVPPNASGGLHVGNALMIAIQDILARYHRAKGDCTLWIPSTDHGGYETQVTFERELEKEGKDKSKFNSSEIYETISKFVDQNNTLIKNEIKSLGASVDWSRFRFTLDNASQKATHDMFMKMVNDNLIYRRLYMIHYCHLCATTLADIELKEKKGVMPLYFIKFFFVDKDNFLSLATTRPEYLFTTTHVLVHPKDTRYSHLIGKKLKNPVSGALVEIIESKRKFDPSSPEPFLSPFSPSYKKYDYEYTLRNNIPSRPLLDWDGKMIERYPGLTPNEARVKEVEFLNSNNLIEIVDRNFTDSIFLCKKGHAVESVIALTWFLKLDNEKTPLRASALDKLQQGAIVVLPRWREKGLIEWMGKMPDWPIARQNIWGIKIPVWYDISDPSQFTIWFRDRSDKRQYGNLQTLLEHNHSIEEITEGLERIYASEKTVWTLERENDKKYLPETDTFDTWYSSGFWSAMVYGDINSADFKYFYPSDSIVIGHDLIRLSVAREIFLSLYMTGKLPFRIVYLHRLLSGQDGQKMSKSLGNSVPLEYYMDKYGADVTRMTLISYTMLQEDFIFTEEQLQFFQNFSERLWEFSRVIDLSRQYTTDLLNFEKMSKEEENTIHTMNNAADSISSYLEKYLFAYAQEKVCTSLEILEKFAQSIRNRDNIAIPLTILRLCFKKYLIILHPFMPFMTEELNSVLYDSSPPLATTGWPRRKEKGG